MKVITNKWNAVSVWSWNVSQEDVCGICRIQFDGTCPTCRYPGDDCPLIFGECNHTFHMHCLIKWISTDNSKGLCPMCRQPFQTAK